MSDRDVAGEAWQRLLESLGTAAQTINGPLGAINDRERAEGYRHLTRILSVATEMLLEKGDPARPEFTRWMNPHRKILGDNPHTIYDAAVIDAHHDYVIRGNLKGPTYLGICAYGTATNGARRIIGNLDDVELTASPDGDFEVWLGAARGSGVPERGDFLELEADASDLMVRQYFGDLENEHEANYTIEATPSAGPPDPLTPRVIAERLDAVGNYVTDIIEVEASLSALMATATPTVLRAGSDYVDDEGAPTAPPVDPSIVAKAMPSPTIQYSGSWFDALGDGEAIVIEGTPPTCRYWSIQLLTRWMESGDYRYHPVFLTGNDIEVGANDRFRVVVAHHDPSVTNWISTTGLTSANIAVRSLGADGLMDIDFRRVKVADL